MLKIRKWQELYLFAKYVNFILYNIRNKLQRSPSKLLRDGYRDR